MSHLPTGSRQAWGCTLPFFNELVQYNHKKLFPTDDGNTGILVIIDHFSQFAEAIPCSQNEYDAITTSRLLLQKWFARHGTPTRMQSENAPNLTAEVSNEFMKASHDDCSKLSYKTEQLLSEASNASLPSRQRHWMDTRLRTKLRAGGTRQHYQPFDYSTSDTDEETSGAMLPIPTYSPQQIQTQSSPEAINDPSAPDTLSDVSMLGCLPQLFSDHEPMRSPSPQISQSDNTPELSLSGTFAPLLTQPSLTDYLSNYPFWPDQAKDSTAHCSRPSSPSVAMPSIKRGRGRPRKKTHQQKAQGKTPSKARKPKRDTQRDLRTDTS